MISDLGSFKFTCKRLETNVTLKCYPNNEVGWRYLISMEPPPLDLKVPYIKPELNKYFPELNLIVNWLPNI
jgi:hypothetical protein